MLNALLKLLEEEFKYPVFYGMVNPEKIKDDKIDWNYFVVKRDVTLKEGAIWYANINVTFVAEEYIKEGFELEIIEKIKEKTSFKPSSSNISFGYSRKGNTNGIIEVVTIPFTKKMKYVQCNIPN